MGMSIIGITETETNDGVYSPTGMKPPFTPPPFPKPKPKYGTQSSQIVGNDDYELTGHGTFGNAPVTTSCSDYDDSDNDADTNDENSTNDPDELTGHGTFGNAPVPEEIPEEELQDTIEKLKQELEKKNNIISALLRMISEETPTLY